MTELSNRLTILYEEYPGDDAWGDFVSCFPEINTNLLNQIPIETDFMQSAFLTKKNIMKQQELLIRLL